MDLPWSTLAAIVSLWVGAVIAFSVFIALLVARAGGRSALKAVVIAVGVPIVGPLIWGVGVQAELRRHRRLAGEVSVSEPAHRGAASFLWWGASLMLAGALVLPWLTVSANVEDRLDERVVLAPTDTWLGGGALAAVALALAAAGLTVHRMGARRQAIAICGTCLILVVVALSSAIVYWHLDGLGESLARLTDRHAEGRVQPGPALWMTLVAGLMGVAGCMPVAFGRRCEAAVDRDDVISPSPAEAASVVNDSGWGQEWATPTNSSPGGWERDGTGGW